MTRSLSVWNPVYIITPKAARTLMEIEAHLHERQGKAVTNFGATLPPAESDMAAQIFKDPYLFDFLGTADPRREREVEQALAIFDRITVQRVGEIEKK